MCVAIGISIDLGLSKEIERLRTSAGVALWVRVTSVTFQSRDNSLFIITVSYSKGFWTICKPRHWRNTTTVLRAVVKSHNDLKGTKVFACGCSGRNLKNLSKFAGKSPCWGPFIVKLQSVIAYKRLRLVNFIKKETPTRRLFHKHFL